MTSPSQPSLRTLLLGTVAAASVALFLVFAVVLPAEYGRDPLGTGARLGLLRAPLIEQSVVTPSPSYYSEDERAFVLDPFQSVEYKYRLTAGASVVFRWQAAEPVVYDLHGEADGAPPDSAVSYATGRQAADSGLLVAPTDGVHGWFWQNRTMATQTITLRAVGFFTESVHYTDAGPRVRHFDPVAVARADAPDGEARR